MPITETWPESQARDFKAWAASEITKQLLGENPNPLTRAAVKLCAKRLHTLRIKMENLWQGLRHRDLGELTWWVISALIARENPLLLGGPGVAKTEIPLKLFELLGLNPPRVEEKALETMLKAEDNPVELMRVWRERARAERYKPKYFHYLLTQYTLPEELFAPIEISLLKRGILTRVNFGLMTGPGVAAVFLDEIFKASCSILNCLLTMLQERTYFDRGGMVPSDLMFLAGASNEMPGQLSDGASAHRFGELWPFVDRFAIRMEVPLAMARHEDQHTEWNTSDLKQATDKALAREFNNLYMRIEENGGFRTESPVSSINDMLAIGRAMLEHFRVDLDSSPSTLFSHDDPNYIRFYRCFIQVAGALQDQRTQLDMNKITWTITPRKLKALFKIALAHALVRSADTLAENGKVELAREDLNVFMMIYDRPEVREGLTSQVQRLIDQYWGS